MKFKSRHKNEFSVTFTKIFENPHLRTLLCQSIKNKSLGLNFFGWSSEKFNQSEQHPQEEEELVIARILSYFAIRVFRVGDFRSSCPKEFY